MEFFHFRVLILIFFYTLSAILDVEGNEEEVISTANSVTDVTCFDSSCSSIRTDEGITETSNIITHDNTYKPTATVTTSTNKNPAEEPKKNLSETQSKDKVTNNEGNKPPFPEIARKNTPKPTKLKPKENKTKNEKPIKPLDDPKQFNNNSATKTKQLTAMKSCNCDASRGTCDINCCCDEDCSKENKRVFAYCEDESNYISRSDYCFTPNVIYRNSTPYRTFNLRPGLLCIAKDNLPDKVKYYTHKVIESRKKVENLIKKRKVYQWKKDVDDTDLELDKYDFYSYGSPVWTLSNSSNELSLHKLRIAREGVTSLCQSYYQVGYLENIESSCLVKGPSNNDDCQDTFTFGMASYANLRILTSPHLINSTNDLEDVAIDGTFTKLNVFICIKGKCTNLTNHNFTKIDKKSNICNNIVKEVSYVIKHNGTNGIVEAKCYLLIDSLKLNYGMFRQRYRIKFDWLGASNVSFPRSGKPGYLNGKPLITGIKMDKMEDDIRKETFNVSNDLKEWLTFAKASNDGLCSDKRSNVLFNDNIRSECRVKIKNSDLNEAENCSALWDKVAGYLYGKTEGLENIWLSAWGDPRLEDSAAWVPLVYSEEQLVPSCYEFAYSLSYKFLYSLSGPLSSPNTKLVGAAVEIKTTPLTCRTTGCTVMLVTTVTFSTVTTTPKLLYPKHPALRIHLPKDFFYPFSSSSSSAAPFLVISHIVIFLSFFINFYFSVVNSSTNQYKK